MENKLNKKGQGLVTGLIIGIVGLVITVIVGLVIVQTVTDADLLPTNPSVANTVTNETNAWANSTLYPTDNVQGGGTAFVLTDVWGITGLTEGLYDFQFGNLAANFTMNDTGWLTNDTVFNRTIQENLSISYTFNSQGELPISTATAENLSENLSEGINRVAEKIPTILKIAAVVLLLGVLVFLVAQARRMGFFGTGGGI